MTPPLGLPPSSSSSSAVSSASSMKQSAGIVVLVDPYSTGCCIAQEMVRRGYSIMALWTYGFSEDMKTHIPTSCAGLVYAAGQITQVPNDLKATVALVHATAATATSSTATSSTATSSTTTSPTIVACLAGGEAGVNFADQLSEALGLRTNGTDISNRCDKKMQQELVKAAGMRSVRQAGGSDFADVKHFLTTEEYPVVLKPTESAGSDGVKLCRSYQEAKDHFELLMASQMVNGGGCPAVLCQEFLRGKEYVVDHVSKDGIHKTMMVWVYDKRPANGSAFVYFGCLPVDPTSPEGKLVIPYVRGVLDALGVRNGPSHGEVMVTPTGPCLVEMNCRARGGDGNWRSLARALTGGYTQVEATVDAYLEPAQFDKLPDKPPSPFRAAGQEVILVSYHKGTIAQMPGFDMVQKLPSFMVLESGMHIGSQVDYTIDLVTCTGSIILMHHDAATLQRDIDFIRHMEKISGFFTFESTLSNLNRPHDEAFGGSSGPSLVRHMSMDRPELRMMRRSMTTVDASKEIIVLVDPYSTGCCIAQEIKKRGYSIMALWTAGFSEDMKTHVPLSCEGLTYMKTIQQENNESLEEICRRVKLAAGLKSVVSVIAGGEAGVDLADALSEHMGLRTNGTDIANRRDKKIQQELIMAAGYRSVRQAGGTAFGGEIETFLRTEAYPVVLKPTESAGSDGVKLCHNFDEAKSHFDVLMKSQMVNGGDCPAVLCQEFLRGREYVVDHVSRGGIHKTCMVWVYDKRPANGAQFVYFGCLPVDPQSPEGRLVIPYVRGVLDALGVVNGPSHGEVMMTPDGPCLVEMNVRARGGDGNWSILSRALTGGYSQVESSVDAYLEKNAFGILPDKPPTPFKAAGQEVILVSYSRGTVKAAPGFDVIQQLPSFVYLESGVKVGSKVEHTIDLFTCYGSVILMHPDQSVVEKDVHTIRQLEESNSLFEYEEEFNLTKSFSKVNLAGSADSTEPNSATKNQHRRIVSISSDMMY